MHYSEYLQIKHSLLVSKGVYDGYIDKDSKLHIDPLLLKACPINEFKEAYKSFINYFDRFYHLHPFVKVRDVKKDRAFRQIVEYYTFPELANTGLGYSEKRIGGSGLSGKIASQLADATCDIIEYGIEDREIFTLMHFLEDGIGADRISDMVISILSDIFLQYTQRVSKELEIPTCEYVTKSNMVLSLPFYNGKPIYFIPETILTELKTAKDYTDIDNVVSYNSTLRHKVCMAIQGNWKDIQEMSKSKFRKLVYENKTAYSELIDYVKKIKVGGYDFIVDRNNEYEGLALKELLYENPLDLSFAEGIGSEKVYNVALAICTHFKFLVEECRIYRMMIDNGKYKRETEWQHLLFSIASSFLKGGNLDIDVSPEADCGAGELDFKFSHGAKAKTVVELKLTDNPNLLHGYKKQLPQYIVTENGNHGIFVVIEIDKVQKRQFNEIKSISRNPSRPYEIIIINALPRLSASKP